MTAALPKIIAHPNRETWLRSRQGSRLGASEAPTCLGHGYEDPLVLWGRKTGKLEPEPESMRLRFGLYAEPFVHDETERELGASLMDPGPFTVFESSSDSRLFATPDRFVLNPKVEIVVGDGENTADFLSRLLVGGTVVGSCSIKTVGHGAKKHWLDDKPAVYAFIQAQHEMWVLGLQRVWVSALVGAGEDLRVYPVERNEDFLSELLEAEHQMLQNIEQDIPPEPSATEQSRKALARIYPESDPDKVIQLPYQAKRWINGLAHAKQQIKIFEERALAYEVQLKAAMGDAEHAVVTERKLAEASWKTQKGQKRLPLTEATRRRLLELHPELKDELTYQQGTVRVLRTKQEEEDEE